MPLEEFAGGVPIEVSEIEAAEVESEGQKLPVLEEG